MCRKCSCLHHGGQNKVPFEEYTIYTLESWFIKVTPDFWFFAIRQRYGHFVIFTLDIIVTTQQQLNLTRLRLDTIITPNPPPPPHPTHPPQTSHQSKGIWNDRSRLPIGRELVQLPLAGIATVDLPGASMTSAWCEADNRLSEELATEVYRQVQEGPDQFQYTT